MNYGPVLLIATAALLPVGGTMAARAAQQAVPLPDIHASKSHSVIERGRYLVRHVAVCGHCHSETNGVPGADGEVHLSGQVVSASVSIDGTMTRFDFIYPNITPDMKTGIGSFADAEIARALRYGVARDGHALGFMNFNLSDDDLTAVISYLRTLKPIEKERPRVLGIPGPAARAAPLKHSPRGTSVEKGRYLVEGVGDCGGCHSQRDLRTGKPTAPAFSGGVPIPDDRDPKRIFWTANLTGGGRLATLDEKGFVARFKAGRLLEGSPMPWEALQGMEEGDLRSIYRYLKSVPAAVTAEHPPFEITP
jgi:mono/diheme cytochrome c family protein